MKQMPVESFFSDTGSPAARAISRTSPFTSPPTGNSALERARCEIM